MLQAILSPADLLTTLGERYATKKFDPSKKIPHETWHALEESMRLSPSSFGIQPWWFIVVDTPEIRARLLPVSWGQSQITDADRLVVFATLKQVENKHVRHYIEDMAQTRGLRPEDLAGFEQMLQTAMMPKANIEWNRRQSYIAMGFLGLSAALLGVDTCMLEGIDPTAYDNILGLTDTDYATVAAVACGYRASEDDTIPEKRAKSRFPLDEVVRHV